MIMADSITPPVSIAAWLACLAFVVMLINGGMKMVRSFKDTPAPSEVQREAAAMFAQKEELNKHIEWNRREHENLFSKIGGVERGVEGRVEQKLDASRAERREDMHSLHHEVNEVSKKVASLERETEMQNQRMASMDAKLDRLIERS